MKRTNSRGAEGLANQMMLAYAHSTVVMKVKPINSSKPQAYYYDIHSKLTELLENHGLDLVARLDSQPLLKVSDKLGGSVRIDRPKMAKDVKGCYPGVARLIMVAQMYSSDKAVFLNTRYENALKGDGTIPMSWIEKVAKEYKPQGLLLNKDGIYFEKAPLLLYDFLKKADPENVDITIPKDARGFVAPSEAAGAFSDLFELPEPDADFFAGEFTF